MARQRSSKETGGVLLYVRIQPRASKNELVTMEDGSIKIRLTAPPVDGAANEALVKFLAGTLSVAKSQVTIISGETARDKVIRITGVPDEDVMRLLNIREE
ncbi:MAG TPA: DUF167 domain-containing protein [Nitrospirota bacterium]